MFLRLICLLILSKKGDHAFLRSGFIKILGPSDLKYFPALKLRCMNMACFVATIDLSLETKLREDLADQGFEFTAPEHTLFSALKKGVSCTLYKSGKLTVQGKDKDEFISFYLEPEILKTFSFDYPETTVSLTPRIGIDESGKGDFFGPLCIAGVQAGEDKVKELLQLGVKDSKKMADKTVLSLSKKIKAAFPHSIVRISPLKYNELYENFKNLNKLLAWGHATAIEELVKKTKCSNVIIDQFASEHLVENALGRKQVKVALSQRHRAEEDPVVAAASILARAAFLEGLEALGKQVGKELAKGVSPKVLQIGKELVNAKGKESLRMVGKLHFKTYNDIILKC